MSNLALDAQERRRTAEHRPNATRRQIVKAPDIAALLDVGEWRVYDLVRQDLIPHVKLGRQIRFDLAAVERWIAAGGESLPGGWRQVPQDAQ